MKHKNKIVILSYLRFPCNHPVLENVFAKELGREHDIIWLFQGNVSKGRKQRWHNSEVLLSREVQGRRPETLIVNKTLAFNKIFQLIKILRKNETKIVFIRDLPVVSFFVILFRSVFRFKLYYQHTAPLGDMRIAYSKINKRIVRFYYLINGLLHRVFFPKVLKRADLVFPISNFHKKELFNISGKNNLVPLTMGVDTDWLKIEKQKIPYLEEIKQTRFLITYFGTLSFTRNPMFILNVFAEVTERCPNCTFIMIGKAASQQEDKELRLYCRKLGIQKDVIFTGFIDRRCLRDYLGYCDVSISAIPDKDIYKISSPTKLYESLGNSVPVVANKEIYEHEKVIIESGAGLLVDYDVKSFAYGIDYLLQNPGLRKKMAKKGRYYIDKYYTYKIIAERIASYF